MPAKDYEPKTALAKGQIPQEESVIYRVPENTNAKITRFFVINRSNAVIETLNISRVIDNFVLSVIKVNFQLSPGWSMDLLDDDEYWNMKAGEFIKADAIHGTTVQFIIEGEEEYFGK